MYCEVYLPNSSDQPWSTSSRSSWATIPTLIAALCATVSSETLIHTYIRNAELASLCIALCHLKGRQGSKGVSYAGRRSCWKAYIEGMKMIFSAKKVSPIVQSSRLVQWLLTTTLTSLMRTFLSVLPVCSLQVHMKAITHAKYWSLTLAFQIIFTRAPVNFTWAQTRVCPGVAMPLFPLLLTCASFTRLCT